MYSLQHFAKQYGKRVTFKNNKIIFHAGDSPSHFYFLEEGYVKMFYETESGQTTTLSLLKPGEFFGIAEVFLKKEAYEFSTTSLGMATFYAVTLEQLQSHSLNDPSLPFAITEVMAQKLLDAHQLMMKFTNLSVPERLASFLQQYARDGSNGNLVVDLPLSHEEISYIINCSRQKVTGYLNQWRKDGLISYERGNIQIKQPDVLFQ